MNTTRTTKRTDFGRHWPTQSWWQRFFARHKREADVAARRLRWLFEDDYTIQFIPDDGSTRAGRNKP